MTKKILLIDDDPDFITGIKTILEKAGYVCIETHSARQGLRLASEEQPNLIILDVMMEDISSGFRFLKERLLDEDQNAEAHIPVLMISSVRTLLNLDFKDRLKDSFFSTDDFIDKPIHPDQLLERITTMIQGGCDGKATSASG